MSAIIFRVNNLNIHTQLKDYIAKNLLFIDTEFDYSNDDSFLEQGIIDSTGVLDLVLYVEETYDLIVNDDEITRDNFDSVNKLADFIQQKLAIAV